MAAILPRASISQSLTHIVFSSYMHHVSKRTQRNYLSLCFSHSMELNNPSRSEVSLCVGSCLIPHPKKVEKGGEDALLVNSYNGGVVAVADGVSGWAEEDVDPSLFPKELLAHASSFVDDVEVNNNPQILLRKAHAATRSIGSATVIVAMLEKNGILQIANLGDCGLRIIREGKLIFSTTPQEHYFDCPYQLSSQAVGQTYLDAMVTSIELIEGDIIVMGSDGLFDNVFDHEILLTVASNSDVSEAAKALAKLASNHASDSKFESPYSLEALSKGYDVPLWKKILGMKLAGPFLNFILEESQLILVHILRNACVFYSQLNVLIDSG